MRTAGRIAFVMSLALAPVSAWAIDVSNAQIKCDTFSGVTAKLNPASINGGTATATTIKVKGKLFGCAVTGAPSSVVVLSGKLKGELAGDSNDCGSLIGTNNTVGDVTITWKADSTTPIDQTVSTVHITSSTGTIYVPTGFPAGTNYAKFVLNPTGVTGAFTGGDGGTTSSNVGITQDDLNVTFGACSDAGLKKITIGVGTITLK